MIKNKKYRATLLVILLITLILGCSPKSNYKLLSSLFDGVTDPSKVDSITKVKKTDSLRTASARTNSKSNRVVHPPFEDRGCSNCHNKASLPDLLQPLPGLCYTCHEDFAKKYAWVHGPVAAGGCTKCHSPHSSNLKKLLLREGQALCLYCHNSKDVFKNEVHKEIGDTNCTECHNPHGGSDKHILR